MSQDEFGGAKINDEYPEMILLCTLSSMKTAVPLLCEHGAIPALCAVASEGDLSSLNALHEVIIWSPIYSYIIMTAYPFMSYVLGCKVKPRVGCRIWWTRSCF